jgi:hypothetical protein
LLVTVSHKYAHHLFQQAVTAVHLTPVQHACCCMPFFPASADAPASAEQALPQHDKLINWYQEARAATRSAIKAAQTGGGTAAKAGPEAGECGWGAQLGCCLWA